MSAEDEARCAEEMARCKGRDLMAPPLQNMRVHWQADTEDWSRSFYAPCFAVTTMRGKEKAQAPDEQHANTRAHMEPRLSVPRLLIAWTCLRCHEWRMRRIVHVVLVFQAFRKRDPGLEKAWARCGRGLGQALV